MFFLDYILRSERIETIVNCAIPRSDVHLLSEKQKVQQHINFCVIYNVEGNILR